MAAPDPALGEAGSEVAAAIDRAARRRHTRALTCVVGRVDGHREIDYSVGTERDSIFTIDDEVFLIDFNRHHRGATWRLRPTGKGGRRCLRSTRSSHCLSATAQRAPRSSTSCSTIASPHRIVYAATNAGIAELERWRAEPLPPLKIDDLVDFDWVPATLTGPKDAKALIAEARRREERCLADLAGHEHESIDNVRSDLPWDGLVFALIRSHEVMRLQFEVEMARDIRAFAEEQLSKMRR